MAPPQQQRFVLPTERLLLRPITDTDTAGLVRQWSSGPIARYLQCTGPVTIEEVTRVVTTSNEDFRNKGYGLWALEKRNDGALVGICGLRGWRKTTPCGAAASAQGTAPDSEEEQEEGVHLLFSLRSRFRGQGFAREATTAVVRHALVHLGIPIVRASSMSQASQRVLKALGMFPSSRDGSDFSLDLDHLSRNSSKPAQTPVASAPTP